MSSAQHGTITGGWVKADFSGAILVLECADLAEATAALGTLPTVITTPLLRSHRSSGPGIGASLRRLRAVGLGSTGLGRQSLS